MSQSDSESGLDQPEESSEIRSLRNDSISRLRGSNFRHEGSVRSQWWMGLLVPPALAVLMLMIGFVVGFEGVEIPVLGTPGILGSLPSVGLTGLLAFFIAAVFAHFSLVMDTQKIRQNAEEWNPKAWHYFLAAGTLALVISLLFAGVVNSSVPPDQQLLYAFGLGYGAVVGGSALIYAIPYLWRRKIYVGLPIK